MVSKKKTVSRQDNIRIIPVGDAASGWGAYPAIREFFLGNEIDDDVLYGFFSAGFQSETGYTAAQVHTHVAQHPDYDVYTFFPFVQEAACYLNLFEQGETIYPGLTAATQEYLRRAGLPLLLDELVTVFGQTVRAGYVLAKPVFWRTWFGLTEPIFEMAGQDGSTDEPLAAQLNQVAAGAPHAMKQALVDRLATLVLALDSALRVCTADIFAMPSTASAYFRYWNDLAALDEWKAAFRRTGDRHYLDQFFALRDRILLACEPHFKSGATALPASAAATAAATATMAQRPSDELVYGCITHVPLPITFPDFVTPIYLGTSQGPGRLNLRELAPEWEPYHAIVGGMLGNFALKNYIQAHHPDVKRIGVCMYRKFVSRARISGIPAEENWMMDVVSDTDFDKATIDEMMAPGPQPFLIGRTCGFAVQGEPAGYLLHYSHSHHAEDLLRFAAEAVELGVLEATEVAAFFEEKVFLMGGIELGVFPAGFWLATVSAIESVIWACVRRYPVVREGYQTRAWAFCAERLGSYLLLKHLNALYRSRGGYEQFFGQLNLITKGDQKKYVPSH